MSAFTFADTIGRRTHISAEELEFLLKDHNIEEKQAFKIMQAMGFKIGKTINMEDEFWG